MNNFQLKLANKNKNNKVKPILPSSYQKKRIAIGKIKIILKKGGGGSKFSIIIRIFSTLSNNYS